MIHDDDVLAIRRELRWISSPLLLAMWTLFLLCVFFVPVFVFSTPMLYILHAKIRQAEFFVSDRILCFQVGYPLVQQYLHENLARDPCVVKAHLVFLSFFGVHPFFGCRIGVLSRWKHKRVKI